MRRHVLGVIVLGLPACGNNGGEPTATTLTTLMTSNGPSLTGGTEGEMPSTGRVPTSTNGSDTSEEPTTSTGSGTNAPKFISLQTNVQQITSGQSVTFTAIVTDPDGLDDIAGGTLSSEDASIGYGPFVAAGQEGTYTIEVSWDAMQQAESIDFVQSEIVRTFRVDFFDQAAHSAMKTVDLTLFCTEGRPV